MFKILSFNDSSIIPVHEVNYLSKPTVWDDDDVKKGMMFISLLCFLNVCMFGMSITILVRTFDV